MWEEGDLRDGIAVSSLLFSRLEQTEIKLFKQAAQNEVCTSLIWLELGVLYERPANYLSSRA